MLEEGPNYTKKTEDVLLFVYLIEIFRKLCFAQFFHTIKMIHNSKHETHNFMMKNAQISTFYTPLLMTIKHSMEAMIVSCYNLSISQKTREKLCFLYLRGIIISIGDNKLQKWRRWCCRLRERPELPDTDDEEKWLDEDSRKTRHDYGLRRTKERWESTSVWKLELDQNFEEDQNGMIEERMTTDLTNAYRRRGRPEKE